MPPRKVACSWAGLAGRSVWRRIPPSPTKFSSSRYVPAMPRYMRRQYAACLTVQHDVSTYLGDAQIIGVGAAVVGDMSSRPYWGLYELDFVFSTLVVRTHVRSPIMPLMQGLQYPFCALPSFCNLLSVVYIATQRGLFSLNTPGLPCRWGVS